VEGPTVALYAQDILVAFFDAYVDPITAHTNLRDDLKAR
jgi:hypothetical protein